MSDPFILDFKLKQHTPIIHFQHEQLGATLRATELKPKLDYFIWERLAEMHDNDKNAAVKNYACFLMGYQQNRQAEFEKSYRAGKIALNYAIRITYPHNPIKVIIEPNSRDIPFFFGNIGKEDRSDLKAVIFTEEAIFLQIKILTKCSKNDTTLASIIKKHINEFFLLNNFGTRQSKGFGSFYIWEGTPGYMPAYDLHQAGWMKYRFTLNAYGDTWYEKSVNALRDLSVFYKALRSGINTALSNDANANKRKGIYLKSLLWYYFLNKTHGSFKWEKKKVKENFFPDQLALQIKDNQHLDGFAESPLAMQSDTEIAIKDVFGLASIETWKAKYNTTIIKEIAEIDRFKSPVKFKVLLLNNNTYEIYFDANELTKDNSILGKEITFREQQSFTMPTPQSFDFWDFFDFIFDRRNFRLDQHAILNIRGEVQMAAKFSEKQRESVREYKLLKSIFDQLKTEA